MKTIADNNQEATASRSVAQRAPAHHGRSAAAMVASALPLEEYSDQAAGPAVQRKLQALVNHSPRHHQVAQLQEIANRRPQ